MKAFHIFSSAPFFAKHPDGKLSLDKTEIYCMVLSALQWRRKNGKISLLTDIRAKQYFEQLGVTPIWNDINCCIEDFSREFDPAMFWAGGKLLALQEFDAPCVMLDIDFIVWDSLSFGDGVIAAHEEELMPDIYPDIDSFELKDYTFPDNLDYTTKPLNTAFLYIPDNDFKLYYTSQAIAFMKSAVRGGDYLTYMVFAEQRLLPMLCKRCGMPYSVLMDNRRLFLPQSKYTHLWGAKQAMRDNKLAGEHFIERCQNRIKVDFPEYKGIIDAIENRR